MANDFAIFIRPSLLDLTFNAVIRNADSSITIPFTQDNCTIASNTYGEFYKYVNDNFAIGYWYITIAAPGWRNLNNVRLKLTQGNKNIYITLTDMYAWQINSPDAGFITTADLTRDYNQAWDCKTIYTTAAVPTLDTTLIYDSNGLAFDEIAGTVRELTCAWYRSDGFTEANSGHIQLTMWE